MAYDFNCNLTADRLRELLDYDPESGLFTWRVTVNNRAQAGNVAGYKNRAGYISISVDKTYFMAHRLAWLHVHGRWPVNEIDHINLIRSDNRLSNLREATRSINARNNSGRGYYIRPDGRIIASLTLNKRSVYLGSFTREEDARAAYIAARDRILSEQTTHS